MIANVRDTTTKKKAGGVGVSVCRAPSTGVSFTQFEVTPTPTKETAQIMASLIDVKEVGNERKAPRLFDKWKSVMALL